MNIKTSVTLALSAAGLHAMLAATMATAAAAASENPKSKIQNPKSDRPNVLWISCEDTSPWLGFHGESYATTPNLDRLARAGISFTRAFVTAPVCSPSRFSIITGRYAVSMGTQGLRSEFPIPGTLHAFPKALRDTGYYCTNNAKTDYNTSAEPRLKREAWNDSSRKAHWRNRAPGQPFFAVFNFFETHQGNVFESAEPPPLAPAERHDPAAAPLPPYYPDTPGARRTIARVHDCITALDKRVGQLLDELKQDGLADDTIVFFWSDHGQGIPRGKRTLWDTGTRVPLVVYIPEKYKHLRPLPPGSTCDRLVSLMDLGPSLLSLLGLPIPEGLDGRAFLGAGAAPPRSHVIGTRDRIDEAMELSRSVRDGRYLYIRNFMPDISWNAPEWSSDRLLFRRELAQLAAQNKLNAAQLTYAGPTKPFEALYDTDKDPWQLNNLAEAGGAGGDPAHKPVLERMRKTLRDWQLSVRDLGYISEWQAVVMTAGGRPLSDVAASDKDYPLARVLDLAWKIGATQDPRDFLPFLNDPDPTMRYWAIIGLRVALNTAPTAPNSSAQSRVRETLGNDEKETSALKRDIPPDITAALQAALSNDTPPVRIEAAFIRARAGDRKALDTLAAGLAGASPEAATHAAWALQLLGDKTAPVAPAMRKAQAGLSTDKAFLHVKMVLQNMLDGHDSQ